MKLRTTLSRLTIAGLALAATSSTSNAQIFTETRELIARDAQTFDLFGSSLAMRGPIALIGAPSDDDNGMTSGSAYLFNSATGEELFKLLSSDGSADDSFGTSVALSDDLAVVGALMMDHVNGAASGAAYLFDTATGVELAKLVPNVSNGNDFFGRSVAITGDTVLVGAFFDSSAGAYAGAAYLFDAVTHQQITQLLSSDIAAHDIFGYSLAVSGDLVIIGAPSKNLGRGAAYIFDVSDPANPVELRKLEASDSVMGDGFATSVSISGELAVATAPYTDFGGVADNGSVYVFDITTGAQVAKITPPFLNTSSFGQSVSIDGEIIVVGDPNGVSPSLTSGTSYVFHASTGAQIGELQPTDTYGQFLDWVGSSLAKEGNTVLVGAAGHDHNNIPSGCVYVFEMEPGVPFCFGDGSGLPCPCGNPGASGEGCANSTGAGANLSAVGSRSVSGDDLVLKTTGQSDGLGFFVQAKNALSSGDGIYFGDGLRCVGGGLIRLQAQSSSGGATQTTISIVTKGQINAGDTKRYQYYYRERSGSPCGSLFNLSNGYEVLWTP